MWYLAEILFAERPQNVLDEYQCESSNVVLQATTAADAYQRAVAWGLAHASEPPVVMSLLGVSNLTTIGEELGDGTDICGRLFREPDVWRRVSDLVPAPGDLSAIRWESGQDTPLDALLTPTQLEMLQRAWGMSPKAGT